MAKRKSLIDGERGRTVQTSPVRDDAVTLRRPTPGCLVRFAREHGGVSWRRARRTRLGLLELHCDAIAVLTLLELGMDPAPLISAI